MSKYYHMKFVPDFDVGKKPRTLMFQITTTKKPRSWYVRVRRKDGSYFQQSLDETNRAEAQRKAQQIYFEVLTAENKGVIYGKNTFKRIFERFVQEKNFNKGRKASVLSRYKRYLVWFDDYEVHNINQNLFNKYIVWRCQYWENYTITDAEKNVGKYGRGGVYRTAPIPSATSLKAERQILIQVLRFAVQKNLLDVPPLIDSDMRRYESNQDVKINFKKSRGKAIPDKQFRAIMGRLRHWAIVGNDEKHPEHRFARQRLWYFILITNNSLVRQGTEATGLKWSDLGYVKSKVEKNRRIYFFTIREGKKQKLGEEDSIKVLTPAGLKFLLEWRKICRDEWAKYELGKDSDFIFPKLNGDRVDTTYLSRMFRRRLKDWDDFENGKIFSEDPTGTNITLYSFRHTKITNLLIHSGRSAADVAKMADTSLLQISRAYFNTEMLANADKYSDHSMARNALERQSEEEVEWIAETLEYLGM